MDQHTTNGITPVGREGWRALRDRVRAVVNATDPEGLLQMGAPDDEYDPQVDVLVSRLARGPLEPPDVLQVWATGFGPDTWLADHPQALAHLTRALNDARTG